ncbi:hypothetical protein OG21DRAFT_925451 [Imleria badia]|nr:hypothetical protein OG21DRAFT_925451 [Imleria badia]
MCAYNQPSIPACTSSPRQTRTVTLIKYSTLARRNDRDVFIAFLVHCIPAVLVRHPRKMRHWVLLFLSPDPFDQGPQFTDHAPCASGCQARLISFFLSFFFSFPVVLCLCLRDLA